MNFEFPIPINFIVIPAVTIAAAVVGSRFAKQGVTSSWYKNLKKPKWTPSGSMIGEIWLFLYILTTLAIMWYWNVPVFSYVHYAVGVVLLYNAYLNAYWNKWFFVDHDLPKALKQMKILNITSVIVSIVMLFQAPIAVLGMLPYIIWVGVATKLTKQVIDLNKK